MPRFTSISYLKRLIYISLAGLIITLILGVLGLLGFIFVVDNTFDKTGFNAVTDFSSPSNPSNLYPVFCENITKGNQPMKYSEQTKFATSCGEPPDQCSDFICNFQNSCQLTKIEGAECHVSSDCPGYLSGEICNFQNCTCVQLQDINGGAFIIEREEEGNIEGIVGIRARSFGGVTQSFFLQLGNQTLEEWTKLDYNWQTSRSHSIVINYDFDTKLFIVSIIAEDDPNTNLYIEADIKDLVGTREIDSFQFISLNRNNEFLVYENIQMSGQMASPATYPGTTTPINNYFLGSTDGRKDFTYTSILYINQGPYASQEDSKVVVVFGKELPLSAPPITSDFFLDTEDFPPSGGTEGAQSSGTDPTEFATSPPTTDFGSGTTDLPTALPTNVGPTDFATSPPPTTDFGTGATDLPTALPTNIGPTDFATSPPPTTNLPTNLPTNIGPTGFDTSPPPTTTSS